ncbi:CAP domain-containing protein [Streptomyces sp. NPDC057445]|uniref:CAP domain-containing protein n=1 Tax=Streptomyces sp. NPDC057445 TaxID=3346136 RepID=UPI00367B1508
MPVRTGLLGASAAVAVGTVAAASGLLPGGDEFIVGGSSSSSQQVRESASGQLNAQGGASATPSDRPSATVSRGAERPAGPPKGVSATNGKTSVAPSAPKTKAPEAKPPAAPEKKRAPEAKVPQAPVKTAPEKKAPATPEKTAPQAPVKTAPEAPERKAPSTPSKPPRVKVPTGEAAAEAAVLTLVNEERAKVGCSPVRLEASLGALAGRFSEDMAGRGFFDHTDPDGDDPWERAAQSGVSGLGGENIARGQADAETVMRSWMNSDGHRANILNCDYRTLGVGVSFAEGGPWWTQDFGY